MSGNGPRDERRRIRRADRDAKAEIAAAALGKKIISPAEAKAAGLIRYFTGSPCKRGHIAERTTSNCSCVVCGVGRVIRWQRKNPEIVKKWLRDAQKRYLKNHSDRRRRTTAQYREQNKSKIKDWSADYYVLNKEKFAAAKLSWLSEHPHAQAEWERTRTARKLMAMPMWADRDAIKRVYEEAARQTAETGIKHSVDHFYPLQGKTVCGLHVEFNLQVITLVENLKKHRSMPLSDMETNY